MGGDDDAQHRKPGGLTHYSILPTDCSTVHDPPTGGDVLGSLQAHPRALKATCLWPTVATTSWCSPTHGQTVMGAAFPLHPLTSLLPVWLLPHPVATSTPCKVIMRREGLRGVVMWYTVSSTMTSTTFYQQIILPRITTCWTTHHGMGSVRIQMARRLVAAECLTHHQQQMGNASVKHSVKHHHSSGGIVLQYCRVAWDTTAHSSVEHTVYIKYREET